jgi:hypothetical protein
MLKKTKEDLITFLLFLGINLFVVLQVFLFINYY